MRNRYLDLLRAAAIVRVIVYHLFGWPWLSIVLPAMGIMFALAGSLTAASLEQARGRPGDHLPAAPAAAAAVAARPDRRTGHAGRRLGPGDDGDHPFSLPKLGFWLLPIGDPPGSDLGIDVWEPLWYIRAYLWFVLLSPAAVRRLPPGRLARGGRADPADRRCSTDRLQPARAGRRGDVGLRHLRRLLDRRLRPPRRPARPAAARWSRSAAAAVLGAAALYWLRGHQGEDAWDLNDVSESQALWSLGVRAAGAALAAADGAGWPGSGRWTRRSTCSTPGR